MDASSVALTSSQVFFMWILIGLLVAWMVTFSVLALRPKETKNVEVEEYTIMYSATSVPSVPPLVHAEVN